MSAGITVLPDRSTRLAPDGAVTVPLAPTRTIIPFSTRNTDCSTAGVPSPGISRAPS
jgi:hypothetical protein